mmetsp:Transcript_57363/g.166568  ORF Transcript_57363/g.166568 Transcript_57363/m.166568 type:complete len:288 (-) Transcript_57363:156-1019(-)
MGHGGSRNEPSFALPQQEVVAIGGGVPTLGGRMPLPTTGVPVSAHRENVEQVKNPLVWDKKSFHVRRCGSSKHQWELTCEFSSEVPCELSIHFHCREQTGGNLLSYSPADAQSRPSITRSYPAGKHTVALQGPESIDLKRHPLEVFWKYKKKQADVLPVVLSLYGENVQSVVHLSLEQPMSRASDGAELQCTLLKQKVFVGGHEYTLQDIYGLAELGREGNHDESAVGELCVICLTDPRTTAVLPCRHLCVCEDCGRQLQVGVATRNDHCPICRGSISGLQVFDLHK